MSVALSEVTGTVQKVFYTGRGDWRIFKVARKKSPPVSVLGVAPNICEGMSVTCVGTMGAGKYGPELKLKSMTIETQTASTPIAEFLAHAKIPQIGRHHAKVLYETFGPELTNILNSPEALVRLKSVRGIGTTRAAALHTAWQAKKDLYALMDLLVPFGVDGFVCKTLAEASIGRSTLLANPYSLVDWTDLTFLQIDYVARRLGTPPSDPRRISAGCVSLAKDALRNGHTIIPTDDFHKKLTGLLGAPQKLERADPVRVVQLSTPEGSFIQATRVEASERMIASRLEKLSKTTLRPIPLTQDSPDLVLSPQQMAAVKMVSTHSVSILTGFPGTGKTRITQRIVQEALHTFGPDSVLLLAPTGAAAQRLTEATGQRAFTIHRALGLKPEVQEGIFVLESAGSSEGGPLAKKLVVVDEASMIDTFLAEALLRRISPGTRLLFVGDPYQLPSVGPGTFLLTLIAAGTIPVTNLTEIRRQSQDSAIPLAAAQIRAGQMPDAGDGVAIHLTSPTDDIVKLIKGWVFVHKGTKPGDIAILSPTNKGPLGTRALNRELQPVINPGANSEKCLVGEFYTFYSGDRVMQRVNDYTLGPNGVFNGQVGTVTKLDLNSETLQVDFGPDAPAVDYAIDEANKALQLAYCRSVHKSQGTECAHVLLILPDYAQMLLERHLFYTGFTRAKDTVTIFSSEESLRKALANVMAIERHSGLNAQMRNAVTPVLAEGRPTLFVAQGR